MYLKYSPEPRHCAPVKTTTGIWSILLAGLLFVPGCLNIKYSPLDSSAGTMESLLPLLTPSIIDSSPQGGTSGTAPTISYSGTPYSFTQGVAIATQTPASSGTVTSCTSSPTLPTGLTIDNTTCAISGTPIATQAATAYTVTASNIYGSGTFALNITVSAPTTTYQTTCAAWQGVVTGAADASGVLPGGGGAAGQAWLLTAGQTFLEDAAWLGYLNTNWATARGAGTTITSNVLEFTDRNTVTLTFVGPGFQTAMCFKLETRDSTATHRMRVTLSDGTTTMQTQAAGGSLEFGFNSPNNITSVVIDCVDADCSNQFAIGNLWHKP